MACYYRQHEDSSVTVPKFCNETSVGVTYYDIKVRVGRVEWLVERRYKDFAQLHDKLVEEVAISKKLLPPKKVRPQNISMMNKSHSLLFLARGEQAARFFGTTPRTTGDLLAGTAHILPYGAAPRPSRVP